MTKKTYKILGDIIAILTLILLLLSIICLATIILAPETIFGLRVSLLIVALLAAGVLGIALYSVYLEIKKKNKNR